MKKRVKCSFIFFVLFLIILVNTNFLIADGGYFPHPGYWVRPGQQKAIIFYENNIETMIVTSNFKGNAKDLVWIIPTPTKPEVTKSNEKVFTNVAKLATPQNNYRGGFNLESASGALLAKDVNQGVIVIESKQVDYYDVNVLVATNSNDLVKWFNENNYSYPEQYSYVLKSYIDRGWYFTAIKVSPEASGATEVIQDLKDGHPTPVKMVFLSDKIVFPLKISSVDFPNTNDKKCGPAKDEPISATRKDKNGNTWTKVSNLTNGANWRTDAYNFKGVMWSDSLIDEQPCGINYNMNDYAYSNYIPINLYVIADGKYETDYFYIQYGNWVKKSDVEKLGSDDRGDPYINPTNSKYFLTSLSSSMQKSQMDDDLILKKAIDNKKINAGPETWELFIYGLIIGIIVFVIWIFTPILGILFITGILILFLSSNKTAQKFGWALEIIPFVLTIIFGSGLFIIAIINSTFDNYIVISLLLTCVVILMIMAIFMRLSAVYRRKY